MDKKAILHSLLLVGCSVIWGTSFVWQSESVGAIGALTFTGIRFLIGTLVLAPFIHVRRVLKIRKGVKLKHLPYKGGLICGAVLFIACILQQYGIETTSPGKAGFITAMYIVLVPLMYLALGKKSTWRIWVAVAIAVVGLYLLCVGDEGFSIKVGDILIIGCAFFYALQILCIDNHASKSDPLELSFVQFAVCGLIALIGAFIHESPSINEVNAAISPLLKSGILSCGIAYTLQTVGQKGLNPAVASLLMSGESVFSVISSWILLGTMLSPRELFGCVIIFAAVVLSQLPSKNSKTA